VETAKILECFNAMMETKPMEMVAQKNVKYSKILIVKL
jgi:hypothetical protein